MSSSRLLGFIATAFTVIVIRGPSVLFVGTRRGKGELTVGASVGQS